MKKDDMSGSIHMSFKGTFYLIGICFCLLFFSVTAYATDQVPAKPAQAGLFDDLIPSKNQTQDLFAEIEELVPSGDESRSDESRLYAIPYIGAALGGLALIVFLGLLRRKFPILLKNFRIIAAREGVRKAAPVMVAIITFYFGCFAVFSGFWRPNYRMEYPHDPFAMALGTTLLLCTGLLFGRIYRRKS